MCYPGIHEWTRDPTALTEKQEEKVQVSETDLVRRIVGFERDDKRRTDGLRVEVGMKENFKKKLARSNLTWTGHAEGMGDEKLAELMLRKWRGKENRNCDGGLFKRYTERKG